MTILATEDTRQRPIAPIDGSTWDPRAKRLILTTENSGAPTYAATADYPSTVTDISGAIGRGGYEGIQDDSAGNLWIAEDIGGSNKPGTKARKPNSYIYRYVPASPGDLENGVLEVLQVENEEGKAITAASQEALNSPDQVEDAVLGALEASRTPARGAGVSVFELSQKDPSATTGTLRLFYKGDEAHAGFDNVTFLSRNAITFVEDAGDTLHQQRNALDSGWVWDVTRDYSQPANQPLRWLAEGRDPSATLDADNGGFGSNEGDNEITGAVVSNGDPSAQGILGARVPEPGTPAVALVLHPAARGQRDLGSPGE